MGEVTKEQKYGYTELGEQMFPGKLWMRSPGTIWIWMTYTCGSIPVIPLQANRCCLPECTGWRGTEELQILEEKIGYAGENKEEAKRIGKILYRIGKEEGSYFLPVFLNNLDVFSIEHVWFTD